MNLWSYTGSIARYDNGVLQEVREHSPYLSSSSEPLVLYKDAKNLVAALCMTINRKKYTESFLRELDEFLVPGSQSQSIGGE